MVIEMDSDLSLGMGNNIMQSKAMQRILVYRTSKHESFNLIRV